jgi:hypothetical protein
VNYAFYIFLPLVLGEVVVLEGFTDDVVKENLFWYFMGLAMWWGSLFQWS